jgi:hypothetical protein
MPMPSGQHICKLSRDFRSQALGPARVREIGIAIDRPVILTLVVLILPLVQRCGRLG